MTDKIKENKMSNNNNNNKNNNNNNNNNNKIDKYHTVWKIQSHNRKYTEKIKSPKKTKEFNIYQIKRKKGDKRNIWSIMR